MPSIYLEDKNRVVEYPQDMEDEDIDFHIKVNEYEKTPRLSLMQTIASHPVASKVLDFTEKIMPIEDWEKLEKQAKETFMAIPKLIVSSGEASGRMAMLEDTEEQEKDISEAATVLGHELFKNIVRYKEPVRPIISGLLKKESVSDITSKTTKSFLEPGDTPTILSEVFPMSDDEREGSVVRLIPRAIGEAIESVLIYSSFVRKIPSLIDNYKIAETRKGLNNLSERLKNKLMEIGYSEEQSIGILAHPSTQNFIRETPIFKKITGQHIYFYSGIPIEFKPGQVLMLGKEAAKVIRQEGANVILNVAGKEIIKSVDELQVASSIFTPTEGKVTIETIYERKFSDDRRLIKKDASGKWATQWYVPGQPESIWIPVVGEDIAEIEKGIAEGIWKPQSTPTEGKIEPLIEEAKKYSSPEEFVEAKTKKELTTEGLLTKSEKNIELLDEIKKATDKGFELTQKQWNGLINAFEKMDIDNRALLENPEYQKLMGNYIKKYDKNVHEEYFSSDELGEAKKGILLFDEAQAIQDYLVDNTDFEFLFNETVNKIFENMKIIESAKDALEISNYKSQLTDIWNKAHSTPTEGKVLTNQDLAKSGVNDKNYKDYLNPSKSTEVQYVAAKQIQLYLERGDLISIEKAQEFYKSYQPTEGKVEAPTEPPGEPPKNIEGVSQPQQPSGRRERGFITSIKEEMPELKVSGMYIPRSTDKLAQKARNLIKDDLATAEKMVTKGTDDDSIAVGAELLKYYTEEAEKATSEAVKDALYDKAAELGNNMAKNLTELGRSVQAASILGRMTPEGQLRFAARTIQKYNEEIESRGGLLRGTGKKIDELSKEQTREILDMMKEIQSMPDGVDKAMKYHDLQNYISDLVPSPLFQKIVSIWKAGLLTGLKTSGLNILSNFSHAFGTEIIKDIPAVAVDSITSLFSKKRTIAFTTQGILSGVKEGADKGWRFLKTGYDERTVLGKYDYKRVNFGKGKVAKWCQKYEESIFRVLGAEDQPFYYGAKARSLYSQAKAKAINKGLKGKEATAFINNLVANPTDDMVVYAVGDAETAVYQNRTKLAEVGKKLQETGIGEFIVPFSRTPSAVAMQIINYSPVGIVKTLAQNIGKGRFNQKEFSEGIGRGLVGIAVLWLGALIFRKGMMLLDYPETERERKMWELEGKKPNSIKIGNKYRSIQALAPAGNLLLVGGQFQKAFEEEGSPTAAMSIAMARSSKSFTEQTFLTGINQATEAISDPERNAERFIGGLAASSIPTIMRDIAAGTDEKLRRPEGIAQRIVERIPMARETLEPKIDILGRTRYRKENFFEVLADPTRPYTELNDSVTEEIRRLMDTGQDVSISQLGGKKGYSILTQEQNTDMWQRAGQIAYDKINADMQYSGYDNAPDNIKAKRINDIFKKSKDIARAEKVLDITQGLDGENLRTKLKDAKEDGLLTQDVYELYLIYK